MADVSNLIINERSNVERPNLSVNKIINLKLRKLIYIRGQRWELAKSRVFRNIEWTKNYKIANFFSQILVFQIEKILKICYFSNSDNLKSFQFEKLQEFPTWKIPRIYHLENFKHVQFVKFQKLALWKIQKCPICKIPKMCNLKNFSMSNL